jgi:hypothetical protein
MVATQARILKRKINVKQMISSGMHENLMKKHVIFNQNVIHLTLHENRMNFTGKVS